MMWIKQDDVDKPDRKKILVEMNMKLLSNGSYMYI